MKAILHKRMPQDLGVCNSSCHEMAEMSPCHSLSPQVAMALQVHVCQHLAQMLRGAAMRGTWLPAAARRLLQHAHRLANKEDAVCCVLRDVWGQSLLRHLQMQSVSSSEMFLPASTNQVH